MGEVKSKQVREARIHFLLAELLGNRTDSFKIEIAIIVARELLKEFEKSD